MIWFDFDLRRCIHCFIVMCWLKASVSINMLYMVIVAPVLKPWTFWLKAVALLNMSSMVIMAPVLLQNTRVPWHDVCAKQAVASVTRLWGRGAPPERFPVCRVECNGMKKKEGKLCGAASCAAAT